MRKGVSLLCSRQYSRIFLSITEAKVCIPLSGSPKPRVKQVLVPGYIPVLQGRTRGPKISNVQTLLRNKALKRCKKVISWALAMHRRGRSLNGEFKLNDLTYTGPGRHGNVKCQPKKRSLLKRATPERKANDFVAIKNAVIEILGVKCATELPNDVQIFCNLLSNYKDGDDLLIAEHPGILTEREKIRRFNDIYTHMEHAKYIRIINSIPYGSGAWKVRIQRNSFLDAIYRHRNRMNSYQDSQDGILLLYRNAIQHLPKDYSVAVVNGKVQVLFEVHQIEHMLSTTCPGVIARLMYALKAEGELKEALK